MTVRRGFNKEIVYGIAKECGSAVVKKTVSYISAPFISGSEKFICEVIDDCAFWAASVCKKHLRLYEMAVKQEKQKQGYGKAMILRMKKVCRENGLEKITLRTSKTEGAMGFYAKNGGTIVGEKGDDYEVEIKA